MTVLGEPRVRHRITREYEWVSEEDTRLYDCQPEDKALAMAFTAHSEGHQPFLGAATSRPETTYKSDFDEDILIVGGSTAAAPFKQGSPAGRRYRPKRPPGRFVASRIAAMRPFGRKRDDRRKPNQPKAPAIIQFYDGVVETVHEGLAYLTLEARNGQRFRIEWDAAELARSGIGERQPFILKTITEGNRLEYEFIPDQLRPLPDRLQDEIAALKDHFERLANSTTMTSDIARLKIYVFGSTEGESIVLHLPNGRWGVVDSFVSSLNDPGTNPAYRLLKRENVTEIEFLCLTHPHDDHFRGMSQLLEGFTVRQFWTFMGPDPQDVSLLKTYFLAEAAQADRAVLMESAAELVSLFEFVDRGPIEPQIVICNC